MTVRLKEPSVAPQLTGDAGMSVIICCHNGKARIGATLRGAGEMRRELPVEILLVDNGSNDGTSETAAEVWKRRARRWRASGA